MAKFHGKHLGAVMFEGKRFEPDKDGVFEMPPHYSDANALAVGLTREPPPKPAPPPCAGCDALRAQVAELEEQLELATAPKGKKRGE